jgi:hypothetical protein
MRSIVNESWIRVRHDHDGFLGKREFKLIFCHLIKVQK